MIALHVDVPIACWRVGTTREFMESYDIPPPSTCYGALLSLIGEEDRNTHQGCRLTSGRIGVPVRSTILRKLWRVQSKKVERGHGRNSRLDFQELLTGNHLVVWLDSSEEENKRTLEAKVIEALEFPERINRFGALSLGESSHLINDMQLIDGLDPPDECSTFLLEDNGDISLPVWVDHVGTAGTRYVVGTIRKIKKAPSVAYLPQIQAPTVVLNKSANKPKSQKKGANGA